MKKISALLFFISLTVILGIAANSYGSGFAIFTQDASSLAQANATTAHLDLPSAVFINPALISNLDGTQVEIGTSIIKLSTKMTDSFSGQTAETSSQLFFPSTFYATHQFSKVITAGIGVFSPFGLSTKWGDSWQGRYIATNSELESVNINPVVSFRVTRDISVAGGLQYLIVSATLKKKINLSPLGLPDASQEFSGDGHGFGFNLGAHADLGKGFLAGIAYRSKVNVNLDGDVTHGLPVDLPLLTAMFPNTHGSATLHLPAQATFGIAYTGLKPATLELGVRWEGWSSFKDLTIDLTEPVAGMNTSMTPKNWRDTYTFMTGIKYQLSEPLALMVGYLYSGNAVPDSTFDPIVPDANTNFYTLGAEFKHKTLRLALSYSYQQYQNRNKNNMVDDNPLDGILNPATAANGTYKSHLQVIGISVSYMF
jgi:long-chain fatty acid transport protein